MSDVTVIGLGNMGGALARALLAGGKTVTVWNRSPAKAAALQQMGAVRASTAAAAVAASPFVVICLSGYSATLDVLSEQGVDAALDGRLVVQLTSGTPHEARSLDAWIWSRGAAYLDGSIAAWPRHIGGPQAAITVAGPEAVFSAAEPLLHILAGSIDHVGSDIGHASALFNAGLAYFAAHWIGFSHGAAICEAEGIEPGRFGETMAGLSEVFAEDMRHMGHAIAEGRFGDPETTIAATGADVARLIDLSADLKIGDAFPVFADGMFRRAVEAGYGAEENCAMVKVLRSA
ncbi:NAD(P)-dependent oxidoreductase [Nitratireductor pacificus]|uniref:6-phosphogluconate dehydrogenase NAD-binding protein n=1 Tax=Nitratireductor pacificus pht-3B TaxID=391937 RepID=K2MFK5_9HYPH|nr:NAD(P)-binding domain-containing protein [Nitratireductor pacificus]EKF19490.1 6-phosphogluconate dehydrogenase NAD-binding protein [Nitratireductor pacificus pht-3B]